MTNWRCGLCHLGDVELVGKAAAALVKRVRGNGNHGDR